MVQYCALDVAFIDDYWRRKLAQPVAVVNACRPLAHEFFDTPVSQFHTATSTKKNPFLKHIPARK